MVRNGAFIKYFFNSSNASWQPVSQSTWTALVAFFVDDTPLNRRRKGSDLSAPLARKRLNDVSRPFSLWISCSVLGAAMFMIAWILSGFASIPLLVIINPRNFPECTPKTHFDGFSFIWYRRRTWKVSFKS